MNNANNTYTYTYTGTHEFYPATYTTIGPESPGKIELSTTRGANIDTPPLTTRAVPGFEIQRASRDEPDVWWRSSVKRPKGYWLYVNADLERANRDL